LLANRKFLMCCATVLALVVGSSTAVAKTHAGHTARVSGLVVSINAKRHTLKLLVKHAVKHHKAVARAASANGSSTILVAFDHATVKGPNGAVAVGDQVTVTTTQAVGATTVASAIDVIGQPNGGDAGKGAAVPGDVTAVDPTNGTLTLAVRSTDSQGQSQDSSVMVTLGASTILAVGDTNGDGHVTLADVAVGDHVVVFTTDATANPIVAVGLLDASHAGGDHQSGDRSNDGNGGGDGDQESSQPTTTDTNTSGDGDEDSSQSTTTSSGETVRFTGVVTEVRGDGLTVTAGDGPLSGHSVIVAVPSSASLDGATGASGGPESLSNVAVGDTVAIYTHSTTGSPVVAVGVRDYGSSPSQGD
jgi:hypothetical protein